MKQTKIILLGGFLGAGKTTTMIKSAIHLESRGFKVALVTNDQSDELIDTQLAKDNGLNTEEITGGCFCCKFDELYEVLNNIISTKQPDIIITEAVGSCTDLAATVIQPLKQYYNAEFIISPLTIVLDPNRIINELNVEEGVNFSKTVNYIFEKQIAEADLIVLNKIDQFTKSKLEQVTTFLNERFPDTEVKMISAKHNLNIEDLANHWLKTDDGGHRILDIDYDIYAQGEAELAWLNILGDLEKNEGLINPQLWTDTFISKIDAHFQKEKMAIAHLKTYLGKGQSYVKTSLVQTGMIPETSIENFTESTDFRVVINIRCESNPNLLKLIVNDALAYTNKTLGTALTITYEQCFSPLPPKPVHRLATN
ncbi:cobalamin biosynthesis protein [Priestia aryabhattai]|jgi:CobW/HypB/UreG, nucleotide-binding domain|uniref:GTP-binding protein n=1 Tax=Bacillaceae TaxID=186817 RepID=UPI000BA183CD|nr:MULTISPECIES: GTP-binding protein [Bacillaceae]MCA1204151.1 CobW-like GTP-binding protein [Priestia flexa]OZT10690.1 cobalamin biosynthesis protein [Priestia aryabhattai]QCS54125.1 cobalamin biosynthesis protein [Priestia flexa]WHX79806.1 GTP-binding protein [Priestia flexa]